jgi:SAM-dependent methyltransferase
MLRGVSVVHDVSPVSLRLGLEGARAAGIDIDATLVVGDFHDLPFSTEYFDIVFCASSIHHTFRPRRVLREMLRVIRRGGALQLENEPIGRALSFYGFRSNRQTEFTPFEVELARRGSLFTFSSPFPGSRREFLFGMIENDSIPLDMVLNTLTNDGDITSLQLMPVVGEFESRILALPRNFDLEGSLATLLLAEIQAVRTALTKTDRLLGARLPETEEV